MCGHVQRFVFPLLALYPEPESGFPFWLAKTSLRSIHLPIQMSVGATWQASSWEAGPENVVTFGELVCPRRPAQAQGLASLALRTIIMEGVGVPELYFRAPL